MSPFIFAKLDPSYPISQSCNPEYSTTKEDVEALAGSRKDSCWRARAADAMEELFDQQPAPSIADGPSFQDRWRQDRGADLSLGRRSAESLARSPRMASALVGLCPKAQGHAARATPGHRPTTSIPNRNGDLCKSPVAALCERRRSVQLLEKHGGHRPPPQQAVTFAEISNAVRPFRCRPRPRNSGAEATALQMLARLPGVDEPRDASGLRRVHRRFSPERGRGKAQPQHS